MWYSGKVSSTLTRSSGIGVQTRVTSQGHWIGGSIPPPPTTSGVGEVVSQAYKVFGRFFSILTGPLAYQEEHLVEAERGGVRFSGGPQ